MLGYIHRGSLSSAHAGSSSRSQPAEDIVGAAAVHVYPASAEDQLTLVVCAGTGGYEGLTQVRYQGTVGGDGFGEGINLVGLIYEGEPPPPWPHPLPVASRSCGVTPRSWDG